MANDVFGDILRSIFTFWNNTNIEEFIEKTKSFHDLSMVRLGKCNDIDIFLINGDVVKQRLFADFVEGGNDGVYGKRPGNSYQFMPDKQIWLDSNADINSMPYICFHELWERYLMVEKNHTYDQAHDKSNELEMKLRKVKAFESERKVLNFPRIRQPDGNTCGHAVISMILQYYGLDKTIVEICKCAPTKENTGGLSPNTIVNIFSKHNINSEIVHNLNFEAIKSYIDHDIPVIIELQAWTEDNSLTKDWENEWEDGHYIIVIGYTLEHLIFADPSSFHKTYLRFDDLLPRWHDNDYGQKNEKLAIVVNRPHNKPFEREKAVPLE